MANPAISLHRVFLTSAGALLRFLQCQLDSFALISESVALAFKLDALDARVDRDASAGRILLVGELSDG